MDLFKPNLNSVLLVGGTTAGFKFSEDQRIQRSIDMAGRVFSEDHKDKLAAAQSGKILSDDTRKKMSESHGGVEVIATNITTKMVQPYPTKSAAAKAFNTSVRTITRRIESGTLFYTESGDKIKFTIKPKDD
jgi:mitochondrial fission protein ELM1